MTSRTVEQEIKELYREIVASKIDLSQKYGNIDKRVKMNIRTKEKFCWFPHKCDVSGKQLFLKKILYTNSTY